MTMDMTATKRGQSSIQDTTNFTRLKRSFSLMYIAPEGKEEGKDKREKIMGKSGKAKVKAVKKKEMGETGHDVTKGMDSII